MGTFLVLVGLIGICWGLVGLIRSFFKKGNKKRNFIILGTAFILMIFGASISPVIPIVQKQAHNLKKRSKQKEHQVLLVKSS